MGRAEKSWERRVRKHFDFLLAEGFRFAGVAHSSWETSATYLHQDVGIQVADSREVDRVELTLIRLDEGRLPEYQIWVTDEPLSRVLFDSVVEARAPGLIPATKAFTKRSADEQLDGWADLLRSVAPDFVRGEDTALSDGELLIRQRTEDNPQELTIWLPTDASQEREREARLEAEQTTPEGVSIVVRRYTR